VKSALPGNKDFIAVLLSLATGSSIVDLSSKSSGRKEEEASSSSESGTESASLRFDDPKRPAEGRVGVKYGERAELGSVLPPDRLAIGDTKFFENLGYISVDPDHVSLLLEVLDRDTANCQHFYLTYRKLIRQRRSAHLHKVNNRLLGGRGKTCRVPLLRVAR
jgi:hypothetical protein